MAYPKKKKNTTAEDIDALYLEPIHPAFKEIFDNSKDAMLATHDDGAVHCYVNCSTCEMTGYNFSELMNLGFKDLAHPVVIISVLTETEMKIAAMVKNKMTSKEIASVMTISLETVKAHRKNIRRKLKIHNTKHKLSEYLATVMGNED